MAIFVRILPRVCTSFQVDVVYFFIFFLFEIYILFANRFLLIYHGELVSTKKKDAPGPYLLRGTLRKKYYKRLGILNNLTNLTMN